VRISARADYALRACIEIVTAGDLPPTSGAMAEAQGIPLPYLKTILGDMRRAGYIRAVHGAGGGYRLTSPAEQISIADVIRAIDGPLVSVHGVDPDDVQYPESAEALVPLWFAVRANIRAVLEHVSLHDLATGRLPARVSELAAVANREQGRALTS
jgi:Rrf2 family protein